MSGTASSNNSVIKRGFSQLFQGNTFLKTMGIFAIPVLGLAILVVFGPVTEFISMLLTPLLVPFFYCAFRYVWSWSDTDGPKFSLQPSNYTAHTGARGSLGFLVPTILSVVVYYAVLLILSASCFDSLMNLFGQSGTLALYNQLIAEGNQEGLYDFLTSSETALAMSQSFTLIYGVSTYAGLAVLCGMLEKNRFNFVLMNRILPDADNNLIGTQSRTLGKQFGIGLYFKRLGKKASFYFPSLGVITLVYAGSLTGFCFITTEYPQLLSAVPFAITVPFILLFVCMDSALDVPLADALMPDVVKRADARQIASVRNTFRNPEYTHTPARAGQVVFQGYDNGTVNGGDFDATSGFYRASDWNDSWKNSDWVDPPHRDEQDAPTYDATRGESEKNNQSDQDSQTPSDASSSSTSDESGTYGIFHFGSDGSDGGNSSGEE